MKATAPAPPANQPLAGMHYHLEAYVCGAGCVRPSPFDGWATFTLIFQQRPSGCRFAIAQIVPVFSYEPIGPYVCWDLHEDLTTMPGNNLLTPPWPKWQGENADALIMKAMALYERE
jgi:hypothetical protein